MPDPETLSRLIERLSGSGILISSDLSGVDIPQSNLDVIYARVIEKYTDSSGVSVLDKNTLLGIIDSIVEGKAPIPIEVRQSSDFKPLAKEIHASFKINPGNIERAEGNVASFVTYFRDRIARIREMIDSRRAGMSSGASQNIDTLKNFTDGREVTIIGMILGMSVTKKGNILMKIDDETDEAKVMFMNGTSLAAKELYEKSRTLVNDEVIAITGKISGPFIIAKEILWPDVPIKMKNKSEDDASIAFISDLHIGSKLFMEKNFTNFIKWLNGEYGTKKELAGKVKYLIIGGDVVDGIGIYPNQDRDLAILDIYEQYRVFTEIIKEVPDYIETFIIPGNHDAVQRAEPQPALTESLLKEFKQNNMHMIPNPSFLTLHGTEVLIYHGTSLDSVISAIPGMSYAKPELAMLEILKRRHLSPIYGGNIIVPSKNDNLVIDRVPNILHMGHIHKNGMTSYHGVDIINSGTWQDRTEYQMIQGHIPTPGIIQVYETKEQRFSTINFNK